MHKLGVKEFFEVHGDMAIKLEGDGHDWPRRAAITVNELKDALTSEMRDQQNYFKAFYVRTMIKEVLEEEGVIDKIINKIIIQVNLQNQDWFDGIISKVAEEIRCQVKKK